MSEQALHECLQSETIQGFVEGWIRDEAYARARDHIAHCAECRVLVVEAARSNTTSTRGAEPVVGRPAAASAAISSSRYEITELIGSGGMGVVYQAYDVQLQRKIALKVLLRSDQQSDASSSYARLLREARAMAQLSDPNVVHIYDVGSFDGQVFIAMELVEGETLRQWLQRSERTTQEIAAVFIDAGRGLAAAHSAGLVHRDFKPDNVLLGRDGRARVTDFGVARLFDTDAPRQAGPSGDDVSLTLTEAGAVVGTPAYMAPEQFLGRAVDARADQFSFCVALFESVYRARPFKGATPDALKRAVLAGEMVTPKLDVDPRLLAILRRGLSHDPEHRYRDMNDLLGDLEKIRHATGKRSRRVLVATLGVGLVALLGVGAWSWNARSTREPAPLAVAQPTSNPAPPSQEPESTPVITAAPTAPRAAQQHGTKKAVPSRRRPRDNRHAVQPQDKDALLPFGKM